MPIRLIKMFDSFQNLNSFERESEVLLKVILQLLAAINMHKRISSSYARLPSSSANQQFINADGDAG